MEIDVCRRSFVFGDYYLNVNYLLLAYLSEEACLSLKAKTCRRVSCVFVEKKFCRGTLSRFDAPRKKC